MTVATIKTTLIMKALTRRRAITRRAHWTAYVARPAEMRIGLADQMRPCCPSKTLKMQRFMEYAHRRKPSGGFYNRSTRQSWARCRGRMFIVFHDAYHYSTRFGVEAARSSPERWGGQCCNVADVRDVVKRNSEARVFTEPPVSTRALIEGPARRRTLSPARLPIGAAGTGSRCYHPAARSDGGFSHSLSGKK